MTYKYKNFDILTEYKLSLKYYYYNFLSKSV